MRETSEARSRAIRAALDTSAKYGRPVERAVYMDVDCPRCSAIATHDVPAREAGRTDYPVKCPHCSADFELWLDPQWFMVP